MLTNYQKVQEKDFGASAGTGLGKREIGTVTLTVQTEV